MSLATEHLGPDLFSRDASDSADATPLSHPLADRMRPRVIDEFIGQEHILGSGKPLRQAIEFGNLHSMVFWGPPGTGKTTLARLIANNCGAQFLQISAVLSGVKDIRAAVDRAHQAQQLSGQSTLLFVDEVHRFNKAQQDAFLPYVEDGTLIFIGATTENPSFELNNALLSRARTYVLKRLTEDHLVTILENALVEEQRGLAKLELILSPTQLRKIAMAADGDARRGLNLLEITADLSSGDNQEKAIPDEILDEVLSGGVRRFDNHGDAFYDQISALHKSVRGSDPDASLYWFARMVDGGCDSLYIARRVVRMASEDIGNADPRALQLALNAWEVQERLGSPEGELAIAQCIVYLASAAKSNAVYTAYKSALKSVTTSGSLDVPMHLRNAPTKLMKDLGHGSSYRYSHDEPHGYSAGQSYFPDEMVPQRYYQPTDRGLEKKIAEKLEFLRQLDRQSDDNES